MNTYTQILYQIIFAPKNHEKTLIDVNRQEFYKYISGIVQSNNHKLLSINGMPDHIHILFGLRPAQSIADLMQDVKGSSSKWIND